MRLSCCLCALQHLSDHLRDACRIAFRSAWSEEGVRGRLGGILHRLLLLWIRHVISVALDSLPSLWHLYRCDRRSFKSIFSGVYPEGRVGFVLRCVLHHHFSGHAFRINNRWIALECHRPISHILFRKYYGVYSIRAIRIFSKNEVASECLFLGIVRR